MLTCEEDVATVKQMKITKDEASFETLNFTGDRLATKVLVDKYLLCDTKGNYEETRPDQMWDRLALANSKAEKPELQEEFYYQFVDLLTGFKFTPAGRILYGLGNPYVTTTLKNCYVIGIQEDSIKGICDTIYKMAETYKSGGGCGVDISCLRPKGSPVANAARYASGPVGFMQLFSQVTGTVGQKGRIGALLLSMDVSHPDIEDFIEIKGGEDLNMVRFANISIKITDEFMEAVRDDQDFDLRWGGRVYRTIKARKLWNKIIYYAWKRAEPGLLFWDTTCREIPAHNYKDFRCLTTNPCGETSLSDGDSCNLGSMNLAMYVKNPFRVPQFDFISFEHDVKLAVRFLDNIISLEKAPMPFQQKANDEGRRIGLGIMGLADMLAFLKIKFDSDEALKMTDMVMHRFMVSSYEASCDLAVEKGPFPAFDVDTHFKSGFIQKLPESLKNRIRETGVRGIANHAIAPTGSLSCIAQCSSSIEPVFMMEHIRKTNLGTAKKVEEHLVQHSTVREWRSQHGDGELPDFFVEAHEVDPKYRIKLQSLIQSKIDQSISNTVNLPSDATKEEIGYYYVEAWKAGCKGITVYRDGSREGVLVSAYDKEKKDEINVHQAPKRPDELEADVHVIKPNGKSYTVFVGLLKGRVYEVFALDHTLAGIHDGVKGKIVRVRGEDNNIYHFESGLLMIQQLNRYEDSEASLITRLLSTSLRHGTPLEFVIDQMTKSKVAISSFAKAIARALSKYIRQDEVKGKFKCAKCGSRNIHFEGTCKSCRDCGESSCA